MRRRRDFFFVRHVNNLIKLFNSNIMAEICHYLTKGEIGISDSELRSQNSEIGIAKGDLQKADIRERTSESRVPKSEF